MPDLLGLLCAAVLSPLLTSLAKRLKIAKDVEAWAAVNLGISVGLALVLWLLSDRDPATVQDWIYRGMAAGGASGAANNWFRENIVKPRRAKGAADRVSRPDQVKRRGLR